MAASAATPSSVSHSALASDEMAIGAVGRRGVVMAKESPEAVALRQHREHQRKIYKESGKHRTALASGPHTPKPPPKAARGRGSRTRGKGSPPGAEQSLSEWLARLGGSCERYAPALNAMGLETVFDLVEANPRPEALKLAGVRHPSCRRKIWQATQQLQSASTYKSDTRQSMEPHLVSARARARAQPKPRTPRITILPREPPPPPEPQSRRDRKAHSARGAPTEHVRLPDLLGGSQSARPSDDKGGVASRDTKLVLSAEEKLARQTKQIGKIVRDAIASNRSLGGKAMKNIESVFKAIDKDGSGDLDYEEFQVAMNRLGLGLTPAQIEDCIAVLDRDGDGEVSLSEFMVLVNEPVKRAVKTISAAHAFAGGEPQSPTPNHPKQS